MKNLRIFGVPQFALVAVGAVVAGEFGTAAEVRAMLDKVIAAVEAGALDRFTKGEGGFKDRDLYPH